MLAACKNSRPSFEPGVPVSQSKPAPATNLVWHAHQVTREQRAQQKKQKPCVIWLTGLSGSGKSTLANALELRLFEAGQHSYLLDGDNIRQGLNKGLSFSVQDRIENIRRIGEVAKLFVDAGLIVLTAFISPFRADRASVRQLFKPDEFLEVYVKAPLDVCESRDPKGMYKKARAGQIKDFTGIDSPYEAPESPELVIDTGNSPLEESVAVLLDFLKARAVV
ncbi:MAG: adenylyl-sulfate kinase [Nevskiales bacterium]|nr:adenylyl-sulfate kinase [Nevskiales bacterium]